MKNEKSYALQWYHHALEAKDESFMRFMMHWMGFNWMYNQYQPDHSPKEVERTQIYAFVTKHEELLKEYDFFRSAEFKKFENYWYGDYIEAPDYIQIQYGNGKKQKIYVAGQEWKRIGIHSKFFKIQNRIGITNVFQMFMALYTVRCNLFHGSKSPENSRDKEIVKCAGIILEGFMKTLIPVMEKTTEI